MRGKNALPRGLTAMFLFIVLTGSVEAKVMEVGGNPLRIFGYISQGVSFSTAGDVPDNQKGFNSAITTAFIEGDYRPTDELKLYASGKLTGDWAYTILDSDNDWQNKEFNRSSGYLEFDDEYWQILNEVHATWSPGNTVIRAGKQVVAWGEMDGNRIMDQINPLDQRRGFADVEFESSIIPIWLLKAEIFPEFYSETMLDLGFEFVFNPNADFIGSQLTQFGTDVGGIWAMNLAGPDFYEMGPGMFVPTAAIPFPPPGSTVDSSILGKQIQHIREPDSWNTSGHEFGFRAKSLINNTYVTFNAFYGLDNMPVAKAVPGAMPTVRRRDDGQVVVETEAEGYYPLLRFTGVTMSTDLEALSASFLGGVSPILRFEGFFGYQNTYTKSVPMGGGMMAETFETYNDLRWGVGLDWKVKIPFLNDKNYFMISPQFFHTRIFDYPDGGAMLRAPGGAGVEEDNYTGSLMISSQYYHMKIKPSVFILQDFTNDANFIRAQVVYDHSDTLQLSLGGLWFNGDDEGKSFHLFDNKDQVFFKATYKFN